MAQEVTGLPGGKGGKGGKAMEGDGFAARLSRHLDAGTRPDLTPGTVGEKWTAPAFAKATDVTERTVRSWRSSGTLPEAESLDFILDALFGDDRRLAGERAALEEAWDAAQRLKLERMPPLKAGLPVVVQDEQIAFDHTAHATDIAAAADPQVQQQHEVVRKNLRKLEALVIRRDNELSQAWGDLLESVQSLVERLEGETATLPGQMAFFYNDALSLGALLEQHAELLARPQAGQEALEVDLARVLANTVGATALLVRAFPSNRERDAQHAMFWDFDAMTPARAVRASAKGLLSPEDEALLDGIDRTAKREGVQANKARGSFIATMGNLALAGTVSLMLSGIANESPFIQRLSRFLVSAEVPLGKLTQSLPRDFGGILRYGQEMLKEQPGLLPSANPKPPARRDPPPDFDLGIVKRMILAGKAPFPEWVPFIVELEFLDEKALTELAPLAGLTGLQRLWLDRTGVTDLTPLAGLKELVVHINGEELRPAQGQVKVPGGVRGMPHSPAGGVGGQRPLTRRKQ